MQATAAQNTPNHKLPPGVFDGGLEIVWSHEENDLMAIYQGKTHRFFDLPEDVLERLTLQMERDKEAMRILIKQGPDLERDQLWLYCKCKFGGYNDTPDLSEKGIASGEHWDCQCGGNCILKPLFRGSLTVANGVLTKREIQVIKELAKPPFHTGKAVADKLNIATCTLDNHKHSIFSKTGLSSIQAVAVWAHKIGLV